MKTLHDALAQGIDTFAKHCLRYGSIVGDLEGEEESFCWRNLLIDIQGERVAIRKQNGNVVYAYIL